MTDDENTKKRLGDFEIIRELGRGGMGVVYEARQVSLNRKVALKVISSALGLSSKAEVRFQREAEAAGKLPSSSATSFACQDAKDWLSAVSSQLVRGIDQLLEHLLARACSPNRRALNAKDPHRQRGAG